MFVFLFSYFRQVATESGEAKSKELNVMFIETSAKAGHNVKQVKTGLFADSSCVQVYGSVYKSEEESIFPKSCDIVKGRLVAKWIC